MNGFFQKESTFRRPSRTTVQVSSVMLPTPDSAILKEINSGKYRNHYLVYARKSTDEPDNQKNSIKYQRAENLKFAQREHLSIAPITLTGFCLEGLISERHSG